MTSPFLGLRRARLARATALTLVALPLCLAAQTLTQPELSGPQGLPPEPLLRDALLQSPETEVARAGHRAEQAMATQLRLGPNDWVVRAGLAQRSERGGASTSEREIALERTLRWGSKPAQDEALAAHTLRLASLRLQAAWRTSAQALLSQWFDALRDHQTAWHQQQQVQLAAAQVAALQRRVAAGDAAALLLRQAEGELARTGAAQASAEQRAITSRHALLRRHPGLAAAWPAADVASTATQAGTHANAAPAMPDEQATTMAQLLVGHPELAVAHAELALARLSLRRLESDRQADPTIGLRFTQERSGAERVLGLTVSMPFGAPLRESRVQGGHAALAGAEARLRGLQLQLATEAERLAAAPGQAAAVQQRLQAAARAAELSAQLTQRAQAAGEATLADVLLQRRQAGDAALAAAMADIDLQQARAQLQLGLHQFLPAPSLP